MFWLLIVLVPLAVPLLMLAAGLRIYPGIPLVLLLLAPTLLCVLLMFDSLREWLFWPVMSLGPLIALVAIFDLLSLPRQNAFSIDREMGRVASLRKPHRVTLTASNHSQRSWLVQIKDSLAEDLHARPDEFRLRLGPRSRATVHYELNSVRRGAFTLPEVHLRVPSRLGLWRRHLDYSLPASLHVYPDMKQLAQYAVLARTNRLNLLGVRRTRRIGQDNEFERLRDYTLDDNFKHIDWRSTARRQKLTVKDFQSNQSQTLIFLVDCGRMMTNEAAGLSLLDHAFNAMLMLSYVALTRGDSVGLICFSDGIHSFVPPKNGGKQMNHLLHASFDRFPQLVESRYDQAFVYLNSHCRKRSLVILISNLIDEVNAGQVQSHLTHLVGRHLPLTVLLRDRRLFDAVEPPDPKGLDLYRAAAAAEILSWRHQVLADLTSKGVLWVDTFPEQLTAPLVNRYLEVKARHLL